MTIIFGARRRYSVQSGVPYAMPTARPYQVPTYAVTPTADGSGSTVHPSVIDFLTMHGISRWRGWRYWMATTGYHDGNDHLENPHILVSHDGYVWQPPAGLTNPIYPFPGGASYNSDPDLAYDPAADQLIMIYCEWQTVEQYQETRIARSSDGVTWPADASPISQTRVDKGGGSPALVRRGLNDWWLFAADGAPRHVYAWRASAPEGPWGTYVADLGGAPDGKNPWHLDVHWSSVAERFHIILDCGSSANDPSADGLYAGTGDGLTAWAYGATPFMNVINGSWDSVELYRSTFAPHENGTHYRVWYSAHGASSWRTGFTQVPLSEWPVLQ